MRELPLFSADAEASRRLHEAYDLLLADYEALRVRLESARAEYRMLRKERDQMRQERDQALLDARHWHSLYEIALMLRPQGRTPPPAPLAPTLKRLLTLAHPDKWAQGQPASELAHEMAVLINAMREQVEGQV